MYSKFLGRFTSWAPLSKKHFACCGLNLLVHSRCCRIQAPLPDLWIKLSHLLLNIIVCTPEWPDLVTCSIEFKLGQFCLNLIWFKTMLFWAHNSAQSLVTHAHAIHEFRNCYCNSYKTLTIWAVVIKGAPSKY